MYRGTVISSGAVDEVLTIVPQISSWRMKTCPTSILNEVLERCPLEYAAKRCGSSQANAKGSACTPESPYRPTR